MTELWGYRHGDSIVPDGVESSAVFAHIPFGKPLHVEIKQPRNANHHRLYWALCARIATAIGSKTQNVSDVLKIATGHCEMIRSKKYGVLRLPKSISFASMDQTQFTEFFERCVDTIYSEWGIDPAIVSDLLVPQERGDIAKRGERVPAQEPE